MQRVCIACKVEKDEVEFEDRRKKCRDCRRAEARVRSRIWYQNPDNRAKQLARQSAPESRERTNRQRRDRYHDDPEYREKVLERQGSSHSRAKQNARNRERYRRDKGYREKVLSRNHELRQNPQFQERVKERERERRNDPALRLGILKRQRDRYLANREEISRRRRERWQTDDDRRASILEQRRKRWYTDPDYRETRKAKSRERGALSETKARRNENQRNRWRSDPDFRRRHTARTMAGRRRTIKALVKQQNGQCAFCGEKFTEGNGRKEKRAPHLDHIWPQAKGGANSIENYQALCQQCNLSKGAKDPVNFAREHGRLL